MRDSVTALRVCDVSSGYPGVPVLDEVSFEIEAGSLVGVVGPNGAGKTTLLRAVTAILPLESGEVRVFGDPLPSWSRRDLARSLAVVPQSTPTIFDFTVREVVSMGRLPYQSPWAGESREDRLAVDSALDSANMRDLEHRSYLDLSGGEQRRALFARALAQEPSILLLDEPTSHLDPGQGRGLMERARHLALEEGMAVMAILHDLNMAALYCDSVVVLKEGQVWTTGTPLEVFTSDALERVYGVPVSVISHPLTGEPQVLLNRSLGSDEVGVPGFLR